MFVDRFFEMEEKECLFDIKSEEGFPVWDILRFEIAEKYTVPPTVHISRSKLTLLFIYFVGIFRVSLSFFSFFFKRAPVLFFSNGRNIDENGKLFDKCFENIIGQTDRYLIVERFHALKKYKHPIEYDLVEFYKKISLRKVVVSDETSEKIIATLIKYFGESRVNKEALNRIYTNFVQEYAYYRFFFKYKHPQKVYTGPRKGIVAAAQSLGIRVEEMQHGMFERDHMIYSYPHFIQKHDKRVIFPDVFYTMGSLWGQGVNIPSRVETIGNDYFAVTPTIETPDGSILFISSIIHEADMSELAIAYIKRNPLTSINFKLHPNEFRDEKKYIKRFAQYSSIHVFKNEIPLPILIAKASITVLINSTVLYETLSQGGKVGVYRRGNYESHIHYFNYPNVYLLDTAEDLEKAYNMSKQDIQQTFFDKFDVVKFKAVCKKYS